MTPETSVREILDQYRRRAGLDLRACWTAYFELGGHENIDALQAFLIGTSPLPQAEIDVLAAAIFDLAPPPPSDSTAAVILEDILTVPSLGGAAQMLDALAGWLTTSPSPSTKGPLELAQSQLAIRSETTTTIRAVTEGDPSGSTRSWEPSTGSRLRVDHASSPAWEMHPSGEELLVLLSGEARIDVDRVDTATTVLQRPYQAYVIPRGRWHRHRATRANTNVMFLTPAAPAALWDEPPR